MNYVNYINEDYKNKLLINVKLLTIKALNKNSQYGFYEETTEYAANLFNNKPNSLLLINGTGWLNFFLDDKDIPYNNNFIFQLDDVCLYMYDVSRFSYYNIKSKKFIQTIFVKKDCPINNEFKNNIESILREDKLLNILE